MYEELVEPVPVPEIENQDETPDRHRPGRDHGAVAGDARFFGRFFGVQEGGQPGYEEQTGG